MNRDFQQAFRTNQGESKDEDEDGVEMPSLWKPRNGSHRDLEISPRTRDFHIPTAEAYNFLNGKEEEENNKNDGRNRGRRSTIIGSRSPHTRGGRF